MTAMSNDPMSASNNASISVAKEVRNELKFAFPANQLPEIERKVLTHSAIFMRAYPNRLVNNLYYDDPQFSRYRANLAGLKFQHKLRHRWYGNDTQNILLQAKINNALERIKYEQPLVLPQPITNISFRELEQWTRAHASSQFFTEFKNYEHPVLANSYFRQYYSDASGYIRITLDSNIQYSNQLFNQRLACPDPIVDELAVMEIKFAKSAYTLAHSIMEQFQMRLGKNSKFSRGVSKVIFGDIQQ